MKMTDERIKREGVKLQKALSDAISKILSSMSPDPYVFSAALLQQAILSAHVLGISEDTIKKAVEKFFTDERHRNEN